MQWANINHYTIQWQLTFDRSTRIETVTYFRDTFTTNQFTYHSLTFPEAVTFSLLDWVPRQHVWNSQWTFQTARVCVQNVQQCMAWSLSSFDPYNCRICPAISVKNKIRWIKLDYKWLFILTVEICPHHKRHHQGKIPEQWHSGIT